MRVGKTLMWLFPSYDPKRRLAFDGKRNESIVNCYIAVKERAELWSE
jgi:hypothetical protein